ncbi:MAG: ureidoglycolate lyase [Candidatus Dormibacter sp.]
MTIIEKGDPRLEPYGYLLSLPTSAPPIENEELRYWPTLAPLELKDGWVEVGICEVNRRPARLSKMERHVLTSEFVAPMNGELLVPIALRTTGRTPGDGLVAARVRVGEGLMLHPGVWHWAGYPDRERVSFWVIFKRFTAREDLEIAPLTEAMEIITPSPTLPARGEGDSARRAR